MSISIISDVHIKKEGDSAHDLLMIFLNHHLVKNSSEIILLGDIFDLMVGPHEEYETQYPAFFKRIKELLEHGKTIHYFEGNHDLHLSNFFSRVFGKNCINGDKFILHRHFFEKRIWGKKIFFSHGDDIELGNYGYKIYKAVAVSAPIRFLANYVVSYNFLHGLGEKASKNSKKRGSYTFNEGSSRESFRLAALNIAPRGYDYIICGHSHIKDEFIYSEDKIKFIYLNNGYAKQSNSFIYLDRDGHKFISLEEPLSSRNP